MVRQRVRSSPRKRDVATTTTQVSFGPNAEVCRGTGAAQRTAQAQRDGMGGVKNARLLGAQPAPKDGRRDRRSAEGRDGASSSTPSASVIGLFEKQTLSLQVCDPHNCDHVAIIERLLFCVLVARPDKVLLARKGLFILHKPKLPFSDMADHSILHRGTHGL